MQQKKYPYDHPWRQQASNIKYIAGWEGGAAYAAEKDGAYLLIIDEGTMADFLFDDDQDLLDSLVTVLTFDSLDERHNYIKSRFSAKMLILRE